MLHEIHFSYSSSGDGTIPENDILFAIITKLDSMYIYIPMSPVREE